MHTIQRTAAGAAAVGKGSAASASQDTAAFDKQFPWRAQTHALNGNNGNIALPANAAIDGSKLPGEAGKIFAGVKGDPNTSLTNVQAFSLKLNGQQVYALLAMDGKVPQSSAELALFNHTGKELAFSDLMGLNQWQYDGKGNAHNAWLGAGLPGAAKPVKPPPPLSTGAQAVTKAFDKQFPADKNTGVIDIPDSAAYSGTLPKGSAVAKMAHDSDYDGSGADIYQTQINGKPYLVAVGQADAEYDIGIFDPKTGNAVAYNWNGDGWTSK